MSSPRNRGALLCAALLGSFPARLALAQSETPCTGPEITLAVPAAERERWDTLRANLSEHLRTLRDLDRCARLTLRSDGRRLLVEVRAGDGRVASRPVTGEAQILRTTDALLTLPPGRPAPAPAPPLAVSAPEESPKPAPIVPTSAPAHAEIGLGAAARLGGLPLFVAGGVAGFADVVANPWLLGVSARWDISTGLLTQPTLMDYYLMSAAVGVHVGRRFELESATLDVLLSPKLVLETQDADDGNLDIGGSATDVRFGLGLRLSGSRRSTWHAFASSDFELSPARLVKQRFAQPSLPPLPSFTAGVALGIAWSGH